MDSPRFRILFVCSGNICRSALAEVLTRKMLNDRLGPDAADFVVASAGTQAFPGALMDVRTRNMLSSHGCRGSAFAFRARSLNTADIVGADLVLTADQRHRGAVVEMVPSALAATFCLEEFVHLLATPVMGPLPTRAARRARAYVLVGARRRGTGPYRAPGEYDIPDPIGRPPPVYHDTIGRIGSAVQHLVTLFATTPVFEAQWSRLRGRRRTVC